MKRWLLIAMVPLSLGLAACATQGPEPSKAEAQEGRVSPRKITKDGRVYYIVPCRDDASCAKGAVKYCGEGKPVKYLDFADVEVAQPVVSSVHGVPYVRAVCKG